jgi:glycosyltransferase involved in cell wall biosynthesis
MAVIADSPRKKTGFSAVAKQIVPGFIEAGFDVRWYAILDNIPALANEFPWQLWPMQDSDLQGERRLPYFLHQTRPDLIWALYDPGNLYKYVVMSEVSGQIRREDGQAIPTVIYFPVEGIPIPIVHGSLVEHVTKGGGKAFTYCNASAEAIRKQFPGLEINVGFHGSDHGPFQRYSDVDRKQLRKLVGMDKDFWVGNAGVNKRTKQQDLLVYAATYLRHTKRDKGIKFYLHTEPDRPILQGYPLIEMVKYYGVEDMFMFKPNTWRRGGGDYTGTEYGGDTLVMAHRLTMPPSPAGRGFLFGNYDMVSRYNCLDLYLDCSSVEGLGLPPLESMACGVPTVTVNDGLVRSEVFADGAYFLNPVYENTWHTGVRLQMLDPVEIAETILKFKNDDILCNEYTTRGQLCASKYHWEDCRKKMVKACLEVIGRA